MNARYSPFVTRRLLELDKMLRRHPASFCFDRRLAENGIERILREDVLDVGDEEFLMLLFVMKAEREDRFDFREESVVRLFEQPRHALIDRFTKSVGLRHGRPRNQSAEIAPMHVAGGVVIGIEKVGVLRNLGAISRHPDFHHESFEKPAGVREVPFRGAHVRHRLHNVIFGLEVPAKMRAEIAHFPILSNQTLAARFRASGVDFSLAERCLGHKGV